MPAESYIDLGSGWVLDASDPFACLYLMVDGVRVCAVARGLRAGFAMPAGARDVWLVSAAARPCKIGYNGGVAILACSSPA